MLFRSRLVDSHVQRWGGALPQYAVGHVDLVAAVRADVARLPGVEVAGATYDGVGLPAVIASAGHHPGVYAPYSPNGLQHWIMPPSQLKKGEWREATTPEILAQAVRQILPR